MAKITAEISSTQLNRTVSITVILPDENTHKSPFKTLYLLHGLTGNHSSWTTNTNLQGLANQYQLAFVMPSGENKFYLDQESTLEFYSQYIGKELVSITRSLFPLSDKYEDTWIGGLSMGAYGALYNGFRYADTFSSIFAFSSALFPMTFPIIEHCDFPLLMNPSYLNTIFGNLESFQESDKNYITHLNKLDTKNIPNLYLSCGKDDLFIEYNRKFHQYLTTSKITHTYIEIEGSHDWDTWQTMINQALKHQFNQTKDLFR